MAEKYLYICDKKPGACSGWEKDNEGKCWQKCENEFCMHTSNIEHAKYYKESHSAFVPISGAREGETQLWEIVRVCEHPKIKCAYQFTAYTDCPQLCTSIDCPHWGVRE